MSVPLPKVAPAARGPAAAGIRVLLLAETADLVAPLAAGLEARGLASRAAALSEAPRLLIAPGPDALVLMQKDPAGIAAALDKLRALAPRVAVVAILPGDDPAAAITAIRAGAEEVLPAAGITAPALSRAIAIAIERGRLRQELLRRKRMMQVFSAAAGHDLVGPPRQIAELVDMLAEDLAALYGPPPPEIARLGQIGGRADRLGVLLRDVLGFAALGAASLSPVAITLRQVLAEVIAELDPAESARIRLTRDTGFEADPALMFLLIQNLVGNGLKYWRGTPSTVTLTARRAGEWVEVLVTDDGIGIPPALADLVFLPGRRGVREEQYPGSGYGLAICAEVVALHRGTIAARPAPGGGTCMVARLPLRAAAPGDASGRHQRAGGTA